ncbi:MAG TPA: hypothetical protein VGX68_01515 [Thermoanaerobaculia bacterium]|jgi:hypothetical protein|nr:hypothetical protein [Thermoanaerobaculia bacterium]
MAREQSTRGKLGELEQLLAALTNNKDNLAHLEGSRVILETLLNQAREAFTQKLIHTAAKQEASQGLLASLTEGTRLATVLRLAVKSFYGISSEKLAEFGIQPFRGRKAPQPEEPTAPPVEEPPTPPVE